MPQSATKYFGVLTAVNADLRTVDGQPLVDVLYALDDQLQQYQTMNQSFIGDLSEETIARTSIVNYYDAEAPEVYTEGAAPSAIATKFSYEQDIPLRRLTTTIDITADALEEMTADEIASRVYAALRKFQEYQFKEIQRTMTANSNRTVIDPQRKYQSVVKPFFNSDTDLDAAPVFGYTFIAGDLQSFLARSASFSLADVKKLLSRPRKHGFRQIEIWENPMDDGIESLAQFVPLQGTIGSNTGVQSGTYTSARTSGTLSNWEGCVGFIDGVPVIKTPLAMQGYIHAVGVDQDKVKPFFSRTEELPTRQGLRTYVQHPANPLQETRMVQSVGYAPNHRGGVATMYLGGTSYVQPTIA